MSGKSATLESKILDHLFKEEPLESPCCWWLELLSNTDNTDYPIAADSEIASLRVLGSRVKIPSWTKTPPVITSGETQHALVYNTHEVILPYPSDTAVWMATHISIWSEQTGGYLMYWSSLETNLIIDKENPLSFRPGDLIIREF
jgi:hypothetical protein